MIAVASLKLLNVIPKEWGVVYPPLINIQTCGERIELSVVAIIIYNKPIHPLLNYMVLPSTVLKCPISFHDIPPPLIWTHQKTIF